MKTKTLARPLQVKSLSEDGTFTGYGSVFGNEDSYGDIVMKGAFKQTLQAWQQKGKLPALLWQHRHDEPLGVYTKMVEDDNGLYVEGKLLIDEDPLAKRAYAHMKTGSISGLSIGYSIPKGGGAWNDAEDVFELTNLKLWEVSLVTFPANEDAQVSAVKSAFNSEKDFERFLRDAGLSITQAKSLMASGIKGMNLRDAGKSDLSVTQANLEALIKKL